MPASVFDGVDLSDPCALWPVLERVSLSLLAGESVVRARLGADDVQFTQANYLQIERKVAELKAACETKASGQPARRRRAIKAGFTW